MTCEDFASTKSDEEWDKFAEGEGYKKCPECKSTVFKHDGCNFITCSSAKCKMKTYFCYVCGDKLTKKDHYDHYKQGGPFKNTCNTVVANRKKNQKNKK